MSKYKNISLISQPKYLLVVIMVIAGILRFWNLFKMPFTYDEMSALFRTNFDNFNDLIEYGVKIDTHPPGVQVFMYYWIMIFGAKVWVVKLPFLLMGLGSILLIYNIGKTWFNESVALIVCSFVAVMQFTVMYSQIARPYISGMFLVLMMVYFWSQLIKNPATKFWQNWTFTLLFAGLCAYNHHFSLLAAGLIGLTGVFLIKKEYLLKYILLAPAGALLYLPNIGIFLHQLDRGGVGEWLGPPKPSFILDFLGYSFNFSYLLALVVLAILLYGIYAKQSIFKNKYWIISGIWFFSVFLIGYFYSIYKNPVLQFSMLIFFFPFLLFFLFGWVRKFSNKVNAIIVLGILLAGTLSLTLERQHYKVFYQNRYFQMKADAVNLADNNTEIVFINYKEIISHPFPYSFDQQTPYWVWDEKYYTLSEFENRIKSSQKENLLLGYLEHMPKELVGIARKYFPYVISIGEYSGATTYLFSKNEQLQRVQMTYKKYNLVAQNFPKFMNYDENKWNETTQTYIDSNEWSIGCELDLTSEIEHRYDVINVKASIYLPDTSKRVVLVASAKIDGIDTFWRGTSSELFNPDQNGIYHLTLTFDYNVISMIKREGIVLNTFIWNQGQQPVIVSEFEVEIWKGNRNKYAIFEKIH